MNTLLIADESLVLLPECEASVGPANGERLDDRVPFHLSDLVGASSDLEVRDDCALVAHKNDTGQVGRNGQHNVDFAV